MSPEEKARLEIDKKLEDAGWKVVDRNDYSPSVSAIVVREGLLKGHKEVDYLLFLDGKAIYTGFSKEEATSTTQAFEEYVTTHRDEIEALRIIYNNPNKPITYSTLADLKEKLFAVDRRFNMMWVWNSYSIVDAGRDAINRVSTLRSETEREALTNLIQLVRYAFQIIPELKSLSSFAASRFELWCGQNQRPLTEQQKEIVKQIVGYIVANGAYTNNELRDENITLFAQMVRSFGSPGAVDEVLGSLSGFILAA